MIDNADTPMTDEQIVLMENLVRSKHPIQEGKTYSLDAIDAFADLWMTETGVQRMLDAIGSPYSAAIKDKVLCDRFRAAMATIAHQCFVEGGIRGAIEQSFVSSSALAVKDAEIERLRELVQSHWIPIADIPEEWKDGRRLDVLSRYESKWLLPDPNNENASLNSVSYERHATGIWQRRICFKDGHLGGGLPQIFTEYCDKNDEECRPEDAHYVHGREITHVMLPPQLPESEGV